MTREEQIYFDNYFELFGSDGWKQLIDELKDKESHYDVANLQDERSLYKAKGELGIIRMLLNYERFMEQHYEDSTSN